MIIRSDDPSINWSAKGKERVIQNVHNLIRLWTGEVPYARDMGIDRNILHAPVNERISLLEDNVARLIAKYEPRAIVNRVSAFPGEDDANYIVEVDVDAGY